MPRKRHKPEEVVAKLRTGRAALAAAARKARRSSAVR